MVESSSLESDSNKGRWESATSMVQGNVEGRGRREVYRG